MQGNTIVYPRESITVTITLSIISKEDKKEW